MNYEQVSVGDDHRGGAHVNFLDPKSSLKCIGNEKDIELTL